MTITKALPVQDVYASSALNPTSLNIYHLGAYIDADHVLYAISTAQHEPLLLRLYKNRDGLDMGRLVEAVWQQDDLLRKRFAQGLLLIDVERWMVIPAEYVPDGQEMTYLRAYYEIRTTDGALSHTAHKDVLKGSGAAFLSLLPTALHEYLHARSGNLRFCHASHRYVQLSRFITENHLTHRPYAGVVWLFLGTFYYCLFGGNQLIFVNRFSAATAEDVLYYVQGLHNLLGLSKDQVAITVGGYSGLKPYVATILYRLFGAGYRDLGKLYPAPSTLKEVGLGVEDILPLTLLGADTAG